MGDDWPFRPHASRAEGMRVAVVSGLYPRPRRPSCGIFIHRQVAELQQLGVDVRVLSPVARQVIPGRNESEFARDLGGPRTARHEGVPVTYVPYWHVPHAVSPRIEAFSLNRRLRSVRASVFSNGPDLVHGHWLFPVGAGAVRLASEWKVPSVVTARGSDVHTYPRKNRRVGRLTRSVLRRADRVTAVSRALANQIERTFTGSAPVDIVRNGVDTSEFTPVSDQAAAREDVGLPTDGTGICSVGRLVEDKGVKELVAAFRTVVEAGTDVWLVLVGDGPLLEEIREAADDHGVSDRTFFPGQVPPAQVADWLRASDIFALPSYAEGLPNVVLEAMACGLPVVATDVGGIPEVVDEAVGRLVPPGESGPLADRLAELVSDPGLRQRMGAEARRRVEKEFTWRRSAERLLGVYRDVIGGMPDGGAGRSRGAEPTGRPEVSIPGGAP